MGFRRQNPVSRHQNLQEKAPEACTFKCPLTRCFWRSASWPARPGHPRSVGGTPVFTAGSALPPRAPASAASGLGHLGGREASVNSRGKAGGLQTRTLSKQALWLRAAGGRLGSRVRRNLLESYSLSLLIKETKRRATLRYQSPPVNLQVQNPMAAWEEMGRTRGAPNTSGASSGCDPTVLQS